ncbi:MAG: VanW family protein [Oscillospiraceae bacterium]|nr:VanW family protein [Oscillospiraceae bacterium]
MNSVDDSLSIDETQIEKVSIEDMTLLKDVSKNDKPPLDPFFDETTTVSYKIQASAAKNEEVLVTSLESKKSSLFRYRYVILGVISFIIILVVTIIYFNNEYKLVKKWDGLVYPGVTINGKSYTGYTKDELIKSLEEDFGNQMSTKTITIMSNGPNNDRQSNAISFSQLDPKFNTDEVVDEAFSFMKDKIFFSKINQISGKNKKTLALDLKYNFNLEELRAFISKTAEAVKREPKDASILIEDNSIKITNEVNGQTLKEDELFNILKSKIEKFNDNNIEVEAVVDTIVPQITRETFSKINGKLAESSMYKYQYNYNAGILSNMQVVSDLLNKTIVYPGEQFSFNNIIGDPTLNSSLKQVTRNVNGYEKNDYFGISEVATVLYDSLLRSGIVPERMGPDEPVDYVDFGMEAIIKYGVKDLKFTNDYGSPIYIESAIQNGVLTISIYSNITELNGKTFSPVVKDITTPNNTITIIYVDDPTFDYGKTEVIQTAIPAKEVEVYLQSVDKNGFVVENKLYKQTYDGRPEEIRRGKKVTVNTTNSVNTTNTNSSNIVVKNNGNTTSGTNRSKLLEEILNLFN